MAKSKKVKRRRSGFGVRSLLKWARVGAFVAPYAYVAVDKGLNTRDKVVRGVEYLTGYGLNDGLWKWERMVKGWAPYLATCVATYGIPKINSIIRRL